MSTSLVLGSHGFVGTSFCRYLENIGDTVVPFDMKHAAEEDGRSAQLCLDGIDKVYFLAWEVGGSKYLYRSDTQLSQLDWNLRLMSNVMPQLQAARLPFLFVSSQLAEEYDTVYGVTKRLGEVWTHLLGGVRVRLWNVYGPAEQETERSHVISDFVMQALTTGKITMLTTGQEQRQFIYIDDVAAAFHSALERRLGGVYDVTSFEWVRIVDVAEIIAGYTGATVIPGSKVGSTPITPIRGRVPGWFPAVSIEEGIRRTVEQCKANLVE